MPVQALAQVVPQQFFALSSANGAGIQRLDTKISEVAVSNDFTGRLSVTTAEGDTITLSADLESDIRAVNYKSHIEGDCKGVDVRAKYAEFSLKQEFGVTIEGDLNAQEVKDLEKLFRKVANIFSQYLKGNDDEALAKTAKLAERFGNLSSLSGLDLNLDVERSVMLLTAQVASEVTGQPALPTGQQPQAPSTTTPTATPGGAPSTAAAIPQPSTGTTAPTQQSTDVAAPTSGQTTHLVAPAQDASQTQSFVQRVLDALKDTRVESHKVHKYLPGFFEKLREDLGKELRGEREHDHNRPATEVQATVPMSSSVAFAYQAVSQTSFSLSIHS